MTSAYSSLLACTMTSIQRPNLDGMMLFEQPFTRVPYENYRKVFRTNQRIIEKELGGLQASLKFADADSTETSEDAIKAVEGMIARVESLKKKLADVQNTAGRPTQDVLRERLDHLDIVETAAANPSPSDPNLAQWCDTRLDRWLVDWALRNGKEKTARKIAQEKGIEKLVDIDLFADIHRISQALSKHSCIEALAWCSENKTALRKIKSTLEFDLRLQEFIELARARKTIEAIIYSKKHLISWQETHLPQIEQAVALLAFAPGTKCRTYKRLYETSRWETLVASFRIAIYTLNTLPTEPLLHLALYAGLASLKLPACYPTHSNNISSNGHMNGHNICTTNDITHSAFTTTTTTTKNPDCPVCDPSLGKLAEEVPFSHHANSTIVCQLTGKIMEGDNGPLVFPGGGVYSREAMEDMANKNGGMVICPRTGEVCEFVALRKVFIS